MRTTQLLKRGLIHYWQTNLAVVFGVAIAVAVLAGALLVGDSVRASLRELFLGRLGNTDYVVTSSGFFRQQLASDIRNHQQFAPGGFTGTVPLIALQGSVTHEASGRVASEIRIYGIDEGFWAFHQLQNPVPLNREILISDSLASELGSHPGDALLLRMQKPIEIPIESLYSRKEELGRTLRLTMRDTLSREALGEFSLQPQQSPTRAVFVSLKMLQRELQQEGNVNQILIAETAAASRGQSDRVGAKTALLNKILSDQTALEDFGIKLRALDDQHVLSVENNAGLISKTLIDNVEQASKAAGTGGATPLLSYLSNSIRRDDEREVPYSIVTGVPVEMMKAMQQAGGERLPGCDEIDSSTPRGASTTAKLPPIILNEWAATDLDVKSGERITLDYYVWLNEGKLATDSAQFRVACVVPITGLAADRNLVPDYPGITESETLGDWNPPFPINLKRVRPQDEDYWKKYRTTPKAFIPLEVAQKLWQSRFGEATSLRIAPGPGHSLSDARAAFDRSFRATLNPSQMGLAILPVRAQGLEASQGATDFGEYFLYFSFFLVVSALLLSALFFKLGIEQRLREIGVLQAVGFPASRIRTLFLAEGFLLAVIGSLIGLAGAVGYGQFVIIGLRSWWVDAVGTTMLRLHVTPLSLGLGAAGGVIAALLCIVWTLRGLGKQSTRALLSGARGDAGQLRKRADEARGVKRRLPRLLRLDSLSIGVVLAVFGMSLLIAAALQLTNQVAGFFGGGTLMLGAALCGQSAWLRRAKATTIGSPGLWSMIRLGFRNATSRPGRSVLCIALIASAAFIIVAIDSFRHREGLQTLDRRSGSGGFPLLAESLLPLVHNPNTTEGREALNLGDVETNANSLLAGLAFASFRVRPGDDASCLNLYQPRNPKIIAPLDDFIRSNRFTFQNSLATTDEEKNNAWLLLNHEFPDGAVPIIVDANSLTYVLHRKLGDDLAIETGNGPVRLRLVGSLADSLFQSELLMGEANFVRLFPEQQGYRFFLIDTPAPDRSGAITTALEERLADFGFDVQATSERLAGFHRVENTYLSTFQMLGGLGLVLGTFGMAAVLLRNVLERRRELALLRVVGYNSSHFALMVIAETSLLLCCGLVTGMVCALLAISPVFFSRHSQLPSVSLGLLLLGVLLSGLTASVVATWAALRSPILPALRAE